eukprot:s444_g12.t1
MPRHLRLEGERWDKPSVPVGEILASAENVLGVGNRLCAKAGNRKCVSSLRFVAFAFCSWWCSLVKMSPIGVAEGSTTEFQAAESHSLNSLIALFPCMASSFRRCRLPLPDRGCARCKSSFVLSSQPSLEGLWSFVVDHRFSFGEEALPEGPFVRRKVAACQI